MSRRNVLIRGFALGVVFALVLAACGGSDDGSSTSPTNPASGSSTPDAGTLVLAAEQEPDCADWIASCAGLAWGASIMQYQTMPLAFNIVKSGANWTYAPSNLLAEPPTLTPGPFRSGNGRCFSR